MQLEKFSENPFTLKPYFYLKLLEIHLNNEKNMIELIESMKELIHQKNLIEQSNMLLIKS